MLAFIVCFVYDRVCFIRFVSVAVADWKQAVTKLCATLCSLFPSRSLQV